MGQGSKARGSRDEKSIQQRITRDVEGKGGNFLKKAFNFSIKKSG